MSNEDYQLEEMENSAVNKSTMAKRAAMGAGLLATGAATAYGAEQLISDDGQTTEPTSMEQPDLTSGATAGAVEEGVVEQPQTQPQPEPQTIHTEQDVHVYHHYVPEQQPQPEPEMEFETTSHLYDSEGNLVGTVDAGTYDGKHFAVLDGDNDGKGDVLWYDENGDGQIQDNEKMDISDGNYAMGSHGGVHRDINIDTGESIDPNIAHNPTPEPYDDPIADIDNDFKDEKSGEEYKDDLAQNNPDYNNKGNVDPYAAGTDTDNAEPVLEEEPLTGENHYGDYHENPVGEGYDDPTEEPLLAEDDTILEEDSAEEYALSEENPTEDDASEDMAYEDGDGIENDIDDTADEDFAYNDTESDINDSVEDTDQYDIV